MSDVPSRKTKNEILFSKCNEFLQKALLFLRPICGREIIELIESKPDEHRKQYYRLLSPEPDFYPCLFRHREEIEKLPEFQQCSIIMHEDPVISKHFDTLVGNSTIGAHMETWNYVFHILNKLLIEYYIHGNEFDEMLYRTLYSDLEAPFYNEEIPMTVIAPPSF